MTPSPPLAPAQNSSSVSDQSGKFFVRLALTLAAFCVILLILRVFGLLRPFSVPTGSMTPAASAGDHVAMQDLSYLARNPRRGDIVVFKTDGLTEAQPEGTLYIKRVIGEPGEHVQLSSNELFINDRLVTLSNALGKISFHSSPLLDRVSTYTNLIVPENSYFLVGDNFTNSMDSRTF
ncbi:MAG TPA: signal peptidase I, partial [Verrucomicrobiae bacterium]|nr:signal peptidase I [Verrucomicrobiae bacterium]